MDIVFRKLSHDHHELVIERPGSPPQTMRCETRSYLLHDFLHFAVESAASVTTGFWGALAAGRSLGELNERARVVTELAALDPATVVPGVDADLLAVERVVGALHGATKGLKAPALIAGLQRYADAMGAPWPPWVTDPMVERVVDEVLRLRGRWNATTLGEAMTLTWPA